MYCNAYLQATIATCLLPLRAIWHYFLGGYPARLVLVYTIGTEPISHRTILNQWEWILRCFLAHRSATIALLIAGGSHCSSAEGTSQRRKLYWSSLFFSVCLVCVSYQLVDYFAMLLRWQKSNNTPNDLQWGPQYCQWDCKSHCTLSIIAVFTLCSGLQVQHCMNLSAGKWRSSECF